MEPTSRLNVALGLDIASRDTAFSRLYGFLKLREILARDYDNPAETGDWTGYFGKYGYSVSQLRRMLSKGITARDLERLPAAAEAVETVVDCPWLSMLPVVIAYNARYLGARSRKRIGNVIYLSPRDMGGM